MTKKKDGEPRHGWTVLALKGNFLMDSKMDKELSNGQMGRSMKVTGEKTNSMVMEFILGLTVGNIVETG
jgi:hypothetical protein